MNSELSKKNIYIFSNKILYFTLTIKVSLFSTFEQIDGKIIKTGSADLAKELETKGYEWLTT